MESPETRMTFRVCEGCGGLTPAHVPQCVNCGAISAHAVVAERRMRAERHFVGDLFSRSTPVTHAILGINLAIYLAMALVAGGNFFSELVSMNDLGTLVAFGAKTNDLLRQGEWFRLVTPIFIHGGLLHLASNSYAIWNVGPLVEKIYGSARYLAIYLLAGIGGVAGSYIGGLGRPGWIAGVGASGAIFGLFGALFVFGYKYRHELPGNFRKAVTSGILPVIAINLFIGFSIPAIDNAAHIGGLITGALLALVVPYVAPGQARVTRLGVVTLAACVFVVGLSFVRAWQHSPAHLDQRSKVVEHFLSSFSRGDEAVIGIFQSAAASEGARPSADSMARLDAAIRDLEAVHSPDPEAEGIRQEMVGLMKRLQGADPGGRELQSLAEGVIKVRKSFREWVSREGFKYGFRLKQSEGSQQAGGKDA